MVLIDKLQSAVLAHKVQSRKVTARVRGEIFDSLLPEVSEGRLILHGALV